MYRPHPHRGAPGCARLALLALSLAGTASHAFEIDLGPASDMKLRWDNTVRYSTAARLRDRDPRVYAGAATTAQYPAGATRDVNADDGDRNFGRGLVSNRLDLFSEADLRYRDMGLRISAAGWYDQVYNQANDNTSPATVNRLAGPNDRFLPETTTQHGRNAEVLDAFVFGKFELGGNPLNVRVGRYAQLWGESLFFGSNGIAAAMAPTDVVKLQSVPSSTAKETTMPVGQVGAQWQYGTTLTLGAYYQFEWRASRFPAAGSYFSTSDIIFPGAETGYFGPFRIARAPDEKPRDHGQGGLQLRYKPEAVEAEFGFYAVRYHDKGPKVYLTVAPNGSYRTVFPEGIQAYGASFNTNVGDAAVAGEMSLRTNMPLISLAQSAVAGFDNDDNPGYAVGKSFHTNLNVFYTLPRTGFWDAGSLLAEVAYNRRLSIDKRAAALDPNTVRDAYALRAVFSPQWLDALPGIDLSMPVGLGYAPRAKSSVVAGFGVAHGGDASIGLNATYEQVWDFRVNYVHYLGTAGPSSINGSATFLQALKDRNFVSLSIQRAF